MKKLIVAMIALASFSVSADDYPPELNGPESTPVYSCPGGYQLIHIVGHGTVCKLSDLEGAINAPTYADPVVTPSEPSTDLYCPGSSNLPQVYYANGKTWVACSGELSSND